MKFSFREKYLNSKSLPKYFGNIGLIIIILFFLSNIVGVRFIQDDAYTSFRYAKNFAEGNELVFNPGERVEGYTNFLWVMILGLFYFLDHNHILTVDLESISQFLSILFSVSVLVLTYFLSRVIFKRDDIQKSLIENIIDELFHLTPAFLLSISTPLIYWGVSAMETTLFVSLTLLSILIYLQNECKNHPSLSFIVVSVLNSLLRPEGMIVFILILLHKIFYNYLLHQEKRFLSRIRAAIDKTLIKELLYFSFPLLIYISFRMIYYGYPLPNTFYAKTDFSFEFIIRGMRYFYAYAEAYLFYGFVLLFPLVLFLDKKNIRELLLLFWIIVAWTALNILIGGDVLPIHRFFLPIMPVIFILFIKAISYLIKLIFHRRLIYASASLTFILLILLAGNINYSKQQSLMMEKRAYESGLVKKMKIYANWVNVQNERKGRQISVAMSTIGSFSYFANTRVIDIVGLTDEYIAHHPKEVEGIDEELPVLWKERHYNADYVLSQQPDYIIFPAGAKPSAFAECALFVQNEFRENYYAQIFYSDELRQLLPIYTRRNNQQVKSSSVKCDNKYLKHYIKANNYFLEMIKKKDASILQNVAAECDSVIKYCAQIKTDVSTLRGMAYYHADDYEQSQKFLIDASKDDETNGMARYYLMKIFNSEKKEKEAVKMISEIVRYSPDAFPSLIH